MRFFKKLWDTLTGKETGVFGATIRTITTAVTAGLAGIAVDTPVGILVSHFLANFAFTMPPFIRNWHKVCSYEERMLLPLNATRQPAVKTVHYVLPAIFIASNIGLSFMAARLGNYKAIHHLSDIKQVMVAISYNTPFVLLAMATQWFIDSERLVGLKWLIRKIITYCHNNCLDINNFRSDVIDDLVDLIEATRVEQSAFENNHELQLKLSSQIKVVAGQTIRNIYLVKGLIALQTEHSVLDRKLAFTQEERAQYQNDHREHDLTRQNEIRERDRNAKEMEEDKRKLVKIQEDLNRLDKKLAHINESINKNAETKQNKIKERDEKAKEMEGDKKKLEEVQEDLNQLDKKLARINESINKKADNKNELKSKISERDKITKEIISISTERGKLNANINRLGDNINRITRDILELDLQIQEDKDLHTVTDKEIISINTERGKLNANIIGLDDNINRINRYIIGLDQQIQEDERLFAAPDREIDDLNARQQKVEAEFDAILRVQSPITRLTVPEELAFDADALRNMSIDVSFQELENMRNQINNEIDRASQTIRMLTNMRLAKGGQFIYPYKENLLKNISFGSRDAVAFADLNGLLAALDAAKMPDQQLNPAADKGHNKRTSEGHFRLAEGYENICNQGKILAGLEKKIWDEADVNPPPARQRTASQYDLVLFNAAKTRASAFEPLPGGILPPHNIKRRRIRNRDSRKNQKFY